MKKFLLTLCAALLFGLLSLSVFAASATDGLYFNDHNLMYHITNDLSAEPMTIEADIYLTKGSSAIGGAVFGTYHWDESSRTMDLYIDQYGRPLLRIRYSANDWYGYQFNGVDLRQSK